MLSRLSLFFALCCFAQASLFAKAPIAEQPAHFYSDSKAYKQALLYLLEIDDAQLSASGSTLKSQLNQQLGLTANVVVGDDNACMLATKTAGSKKGFYHLSVCLLETNEGGLEKANNVDLSIDKLVEEEGNDSEDQWLAYTYYNLAIFAVDRRDNGTANRYFDKALSYIQASEEGRALYNKIWLERAYAEYYINQFAAAMEAFEKVGLDSEFKNEALLGYGWAAFYSYQRGIALESWRQVALQKNKSMTVYEALIAIPFALEKANAYSRSLTAYQYATSEYEQVLRQIDQLQSDLKLEDIQSYVAGNDESVPAMLPELLGVAFTRKAFRQLIDEAMVLREQEVLVEKQLQKLQQVQQLVSAGKNKSSEVYEASLKQLNSQSATLSAQIASLRERFVNYILAHPDASDYLKDLVNQYQQLKALASNSENAVQSKLNGLQVILLINGYYEGLLSKETLQGLTGLMKQKRLVESQVKGVSATYAALQQSPGVRQARFTALQQRIASLQQQQKEHAVLIQKKLLLMTQNQLAEYEKQIIGFAKQARIASARLQEEFYQLGGNE